MALDLLHGQSIFPGIADRWGRLLPLHLSFARWSREVAAHGADVGLKSIVRRSLQPFLTADLIDLLDRAIDERRILLLVDGLDEWSNEQAARTALSILVTTVQTHEIPTIVTGRPRGMAPIGNLPSDWRRAEIAPLSTVQQASIAARWFDRYAAPLREAPQAGSPHQPDRTARFMAELARDRSLIALAETPLLLIGLVTLSLRTQMLPRSRIEAYRQLVALLLESHPNSRATAAGDVEPRFRQIEDPEHRRAAIAYLAFSLRSEGGDAGVPIARARSLLSGFLQSAAGFGMEAARAGIGAAEILAVNAETRGMLVEKAPGEIGFAHASFEEFLSAEHLGGFPFDRICRFVGDEAGNPRWRNVIVNLLGMIPRRNEVDSLVASIEEAEVGPLGTAYRSGLLAEIGFLSAGRSPGTAQRLVQEAIRLVEIGDWMPAREDALRSALKGFGDPSLGAMVEERLPSWTPSRASNRSGLIMALGTWPTASDVADAVWRALYDEDRATQRAAATAYARLHPDAVAAADRLVDAMSIGAQPSVAATMLESLLAGWPQHPRLEALLVEARRSTYPALRIIAIGGLAARGQTTTETRDEVLSLDGTWSGLDWADTPHVTELLVRYWPDDDALIDGALARVEPSQASIWEYTSAQVYLLNCSASNPKVRRWLLGALTGKVKFSTMGMNGFWVGVGRFAKQDPLLREAAVAYWMEPNNRLIDLRELSGLVATVPDERLRDVLIEIARDDTSIQKHWAVKALVSGWGTDDAAVDGLFSEIRSWPDRRLFNLGAMMPMIEPDHAACRRRLISLGRDPAVRRDLLAVGFEACGCDGTDDEAVAILLATEPRDLISSLPILCRSFKVHPDVLALARDLLLARDPPFETLAVDLWFEPDIRGSLLRAATPLPLELRTVIAETAVTGGAGTALGAIVEDYDGESDPELMTRLSIAHHRRLSGEGRKDEVLPKLLNDLLSYGFRLEPRRAAALAGATIIGELDRVATLRENGKLANLVVSSPMHRIADVKRLMCENWQRFRDVFGDTLKERLSTFNDFGIGDVLAEGASLSEAATAEFIASAEDGSMAATPTAIRMLALLQPRSPLLLSCCLRMLDSQHYNNQIAITGEIALVLADQFDGDESVGERLVEEMRTRQSASSILTLAIHSPGHPALDEFKRTTDDGPYFGEWALAVHLAASMENAAGFVSLVTDLVTRPYQTQFDAQKITNIAIEARLRRDPEVAALFRGMIKISSHPSVLASVPRFLAAAGILEKDDRAKVGDLLATIAREQILPLAGYDAVANRIRAVRTSLLDALHSGD
nr:NACHT domain-containing protein [Polymorphobacter megasporae]